MHLTDVPNVILVASGKGGVGKTTVSSDIARTLRDQGYETGLIDADISTPNSPEVVGGEGQDLSDQRLSDHDALVPPMVNGIQLVSQGVVLPDDVPVLRDGTWRSEAVADYIENVEWRDGTEVVVIDSPPGTGEELQVVASAAMPDLGIIVTTPHPSSIRDAKKTHEFFNEADIYQKAVLNMAYIPSDAIVAHATRNADCGEVQGVGEKTWDTITNLLGDEAEDFPLFGFNTGTDEDFPVDFEAELPYTPKHKERRDAIEPMLDDYFSTLEVEL